MNAVYFHSHEIGMLNARVEETRLDPFARIYHGCLLTCSFIATVFHTSILYIHFKRILSSVM